MGSLYFILKNTVITFMIVSFLQIKVGSKTLETRLMSLVRESLAPKFLGHEPFEMDGMQFSKDQIKDIKSKVKESDFYKEATSGMREAIMEEMQTMFKEAAQNNNGNEEESK